MKYLYVQFSDKKIYRIPASVIAKSRADYYAIKVDGAKPGSRIHLDEYEYSLNCSEELTDWASNNMDWSDVCANAELVGCVSADYDQEWVNAVMYIDSEEA